MRRQTLALAAAVSLAATLGGCAGAGAQSGSGSESGASTAGALTISGADGSLQTENNNPLLGTSSAIQAGYGYTIYEPLAIVNTINPSADPTPWLASEVTWNEDFTSVVFTARSDVKWTDGEEFTADDIAFSYNLLTQFPALNSQALPIESVVAEGDKVTVTYSETMQTKIGQALQVLVVPEHIWSTFADPTTELVEEPVGTGPYTLTSWSTQSVQMDRNPEYWGGEPAVPTLYYTSFNDNTSMTTALANGDLDWGAGFVSNYQSVFIDKDPEHNHFWAVAGLGIDALFLNTTTKPFNDVAFRNALNMVIDREQIQQIAQEGGAPVLSSVTGLPTPAGDAFISDQFKDKSFTVDVDKAKKILQDAGYTWVNDVLTDPEGETVSLSLTDPAGWSDYINTLNLIQVSAQSLGVQATVDTVDADTWFDDVAKGNFQATIHWTDTGFTPWNIYSNMMDGQFLVKVGETATWNFGRYENADVTAALAEYATTTDEAAKKEAMDKIQEIFVEDSPAIAVSTRPYRVYYNTRSYVGWPDESDPYAQPTAMEVSVLPILMHLKPASE